jgi:hypothetical protein
MISYSTHSGKRLVSLAILLLLLGTCAMFHALPMAAAADTPQSAGKIDEQRLAGRWVRPDGGYVLELKEIGKDGSLKAGYFNPQPIKVFQATWSSDGGTIKLFVELRDVNYPGSKYNLRYDPKTDRLTGTYFQAVQRETYDVQFVRGK